MEFISHDSAQSANYVDSCILVAPKENDDPVEIPLEHDGTVLMSSIQSQFPNAIGIKFRNPATRAFRAVKLADNVLYPPNLENGWGASDVVYIVNVLAGDASGTPRQEPEQEKQVDSRKRGLSTAGNHVNGEGEMTRANAAKRALSSICSDLIVLNLPYTFSDTDLRNQFVEYGELVLCEIKKDQNSGKSKGFGFVRFASYEDQKKVQGQTLTIEGRRVEVKKPKSATQQDPVGPLTSSRLFVGQLDESCTRSDLEEYFSQFGDILSMFYEQGKKNYAFVEFEDWEIAKAVLKENDHWIKGKHIIIRPAERRSKGNPQQNGVAVQNQNLPPYPSAMSGDSPYGYDSRRTDLGPYSAQNGAPHYNSRNSFEGPQDSMYSSPVAPSSGGLGNIGNSGGGGGGFKGGEAMMSTMAKMMAEAVSNQLASQFAPHQASRGGAGSNAGYYESANGAGGFYGHEKYGPQAEAAFNARPRSPSPARTKPDPYMTSAEFGRYMSR